LYDARDKGLRCGKRLSMLTGRDPATGGSRETKDLGKEPLNLKK